MHACLACSITDIAKKLLACMLACRYCVSIHIDKRGPGSMLFGLMACDANTGADPGKTNRPDRCYYLANGIVRCVLAWPG